MEYYIIYIITHSLISQSLEYDIFQTLLLKCIDLLSAIIYHVIVGYGEMAELVEGARLEIVFRLTPDEGSNPSLSAICGCNSLLDTF